MGPLRNRVKDIEPTHPKFDKWEKTYLSLFIYYIFIRLTCPIYKCWFQQQKVIQMGLNLHHQAVEVRDFER